MKKLIAAVAVAAVAVIGSASTYERIEFVDTTGTQWIDTGVRGNPKKTLFDAKFMVLEAPASEVALFGAYYRSPDPKDGKNYNETDHITYNNKSLAFTLSGTIMYPNFVRSRAEQNYYHTYAAMTPVLLIHEKPTLCYFDQVHVSGKNIQCGYEPYGKDKVDCQIGNIYLGNVNATAAINDGEGAVNGELLTAEGDLPKIRWRHFAVRTDGELVCDLYPVRRDDGVCGFYDEVGQQFLASCGADPFVGPKYITSDEAFGGAVTPDVGTIVTVADEKVESFDAAKIDALNGWGGLRLLGDDSVVEFVGLTAAKSLTVPISGKGRVYVWKSSNTLTLESDNSAFDGAYVFSNATVSALYSKSLGETNRIDVWESDQKCQLLLSCSGGAYSNEWHLHAVDNSSQNATIQTTAVGASMTGPVHLYNSVRVVNGSCSISFKGPVIGHGTGTIRLAMGANAAGFYGVEKNIHSNTVVSSCNATIIGAKIHSDPKTLANWTYNYSNYGNIGIRYDCSMRCDIDNAFDETCGLVMCYDDGWDTADTGRFNLNGHNQRCGKLITFLSKPNDYGKNGAKPVIFDMDIYSPKGQPATLTIHETCLIGNYQTGNNGYANYFPGRLTGSASLTLDTLPEFAAGKIRLPSAKNTTDGEIAARRGTIELMEGSACSNLTALVTSGEGQLVVNTSDLGIANTNNLEIVACTNVAANTLPLTIGEGCSITAKVAVVGNGRFLDAGVYTKANLPRYIGGDGELVVKEYGGPKGMLLLIR